MYERPRWDRPMLKSYARTALKNYYWKAVLASLIVTILSGSYMANSGIKVEQEVTSGILQNSLFSVNDASVTLRDFIFPRSTADAAVFGIVGLILAIIVLSAIALGSLYSIFVANPLSVGHHRFYLDNRFAPTDIGRIFRGFTRNYGNVTKTMFLRSLYIFCWSLLFIIPGFVKSYEYAMIPYILAENPDLPTERVFQLSKEMMRGRKWDLFVLHLSFIGWRMLASLVIVGNIFLNPYINATNAEVYLWLRYDALHLGYAQPHELDGMFGSAT